MQFAPRGGTSLTDEALARKGALAALACDLGSVYRVSIDDHDPSRPRYVATARKLGTHPHTVVTADPAELRSALAHITSPDPPITSGWG